MRVSVPKTRMPLLYVCGPFATATPEERVEVMAARQRALELGWCPIWTPALLADFLADDEDDERAIALQVSVSVALRCDALVIVGDRVTQGMGHELAAWIRSGKPDPVRARHLGEAPSGPTRKLTVKGVTRPGPVAEDVAFESMDQLKGALQVG